MLEKINDIEKALNSKGYLSALALALTIPDICGRIEYPDYKHRNGKRDIGRQYAEWFDNWANQYYADPEGWTEDYKKAKNPIFTGEMCYALRCSFLHAGNTDIDSRERIEEDEDFHYAYTFGLALGGVDSVSSSWSNNSDIKSKVKKTISVRLDVEQLCQNICRAVESYYKTKDPLLFKDHNIEIIDYRVPPMKRI